MNINPALIDIVRDEWKPGQELGGLIHSEESFGVSFPSSFVIPRNEWKDRIDDRKSKNYALQNFFDYVYNQNPESSCVYNAACRCYAIRYAVQYGKKYMFIPSPMSGYNQVARSRNSGSTCWGAMEHLTEVGILFSDKHANFKHTYQENTPFSRNMPQGWRDTARHLRVAKNGWFSIGSKEEFASALLHDMPICYGRKGHSICGEDLLHDGRRFLVRYCDSYSKSRGDNGRLYDSESNWSTGGAWCCAETLAPDDPSQPAGPKGGTL
jgi:hypothetical protein